MARPTEMPNDLQIVLDGLVEGEEFLPSSRECHPHPFAIGIAFTKGTRPREFRVSMLI